MDDAVLQKFWANKKMVKAVYEHITASLNTQALEKVYSGLSTAGIPDAKDALERSLTELHDKFDPKPVVKPRSSR